MKDAHSFENISNSSIKVNSYNLFSHRAINSLSTVENPIVGDQMTLFGRLFSVTDEDQSLSPSREKISVGCSPLATSRANKVSSVLLAIGPLTVKRPEPGGVFPPRGILPCEVLIPLSPHKAEGILIEPPPSEPVPKGIMPEAKAADVPPEDPPGEYS